MKHHVQDILDAFLPAMAQIQASNGSDDHKCPSSNALRQMAV
jgi:hypothetical protein